MDIKQLQVRIDKKKADIAKIQKRIDKWQKVNNEAGFLKDWEWFVSDPKALKTRDDLVKEKKKQDPTSNAEAWVKMVEDEYYETVKSEIKRAQRDLDEANNTLAKYESQLANQEEKKSVAKIPVIVEFLDNWKQAMREYIAENVKIKQEYYRINHEMCELYNNSYVMIRDGEITRDEYLIKEHEYRRQLKILKAQINPITDMVYSRNDSDNINHEELEKILEKEADTKYWNMVAKVQNVVGEITDASNLKIGHDGNINGLIIGTDGKANIETIYAGGYNQDTIVNVKHGQVLHFRVLVHEVK